MALFGEVTVDLGVLCGGFPFGFGGESMASPSGVGIGLEVADVGDGFVIVEWPGPVEGVLHPAIALAEPVEG